ncbi:MAG: epimerase [Alphaproteobacteria bacterium RIFCSPHIGHO2_12_FULL_66_14]|jgi:putative NADH-flavin reductase|nr:MAG: epimerase [Alphaproteobacteria bacterium RIFCSPHIGHO2_12_FULL_66_14]
MRFLLLGASGGVGRRILVRGRTRGHTIRAQTRDAARLTGQPSGIEVVAADPTDAVALHALVTGQEAVIISLGTTPGRRTTLFSDVTAKLITAMAAEGVRRLVAITGVGAGETRGHGGFFYDRIIYPLFTRPFYEDKDRQERLIRESTLDWVLVRPAPFKATAGSTPLEILTEIRPDTALRRITRDEVASFVLDQLVDDRYLRRPVFIGHTI